MSKVIGLAWVKPTSLQLVVRNKGYDTRIFPGDTDWSQFMTTASSAKKVAVVTDKRQFKKAIEAELPLIVVCIPDVEWLTRRGIKCLDGKLEGDNQIQLVITPTQIYEELNSSDAYTASLTDSWLSKSNPAKRCAGCKHLQEECGYEPTPTSKRPCNTGWEEADPSTAYKNYNLSQLIHLALNGSREDLLMIDPKSFWKATYQFATGQMGRAEWITDHARLLKSSGTSKSKLQNIVLWVKRYGSKLQQKKISNPPSKLDIRLVNKLLVSNK